MMYFIEAWVKDPGQEEAKKHIFRQKAANKSLAVEYVFRHVDALVDVINIYSADEFFESALVRNARANFKLKSAYLRENSDGTLTVCSTDDDE